MCNVMLITYPSVFFRFFLCKYPSCATIPTTMYGAVLLFIFISLTRCRLTSTFNTNTLCVRYCILLPSIYIHTLMSYSCPFSGFFFEFNKESVRMVLPRRLRVVATALTPLLDRVECFALFKAFIPRLGNPLSCSSHMYHPSHRPAGRSDTTRTASASNGIRILPPVRRLHRSLQTLATAAAGHSDIGRVHGAPSVFRRSASTEVGGEVVPTEQHEGLTIKDARHALRSLFGHDDFRDGQVGKSMCANF